MTREALKKMFRDCRPRVIRWELIGNPLLRRIMRISENSRLRYEKAKRTIYNNKTLTDAQRDRKWNKAFDLNMASYEKTAVIQRQYDRAWERRELARLKRRRA